MDASKLFPQPRKIDRADGSIAADTPVDVRHETALPSQGFVLDTTSEPIQLLCADDAGERYGKTTLEQIRSQCGDQLPRLKIHDSPDFQVRGVHAGHQP